MSPGLTSAHLVRMTKSSTPLIDILGKALTSEVKSLFDATVRDAVADMADSLVEVAEPFLDEAQATKVREAVRRMVGDDSAPESTDAPEAAEPGAPTSDLARTIDPRLFHALTRSVSIDAELAMRQSQAVMAAAKRDVAEEIARRAQERLDDLLTVARGIAEADVINQYADARPLAVKALAEYIDAAGVCFDDNPTANIFVAVRDGLLSVDDAIDVVTKRNAHVERALAQQTERLVREESAYDAHVEDASRTRGDIAALAEALARPLLVTDDYVMRVDEYQPRLTAALRNMNR